MPGKKRSTNDSVTLFSPRGTQVTVPASAYETLVAMGFTTSPATPGEKDSPKE